MVYITNISAPFKPLNLSEPNSTVLETVLETVLDTETINPCTAPKSCGYKYPFMIYDDILGDQAKQPGKNIQAYVGGHVDWGAKPFTSYLQYPVVNCLNPSSLSGSQMLKQVVSPEINQAGNQKPQVPQKALDMVKGSAPDDWYQQNSSNGYMGWVHKTAKISNAQIMGNAIVSKNAVVGNSYVYDNAVVEEGAVIGDGCYINQRAIICAGSKVGDYSSIRGTARIKGTVGQCCNISGKTVVRFGTHIPDHTTLEETPLEYRTQKARGIGILKTSGFDVPISKLYRIERLKTKTQLEKLVGKFVRPCPVTPRHGFVDSRSINSVDEARQLVKETKLADGLAEFVVMPFIDAPYSGIWTDGQLCIGAGTDGATSGKNSTTIPVLGQPESKVEWTELLKQAGVKQSPYIELLWTKHEVKDYDQEGAAIKSVRYKTMFVQLRDGPKLPNSIDFIPKKMEVKQVVKAEGDLLAWESFVKTFKPGTVVHHPGGSLASHYSVHAFLSDIPVVISYEPKIGEVLEPNTTTPKANIDDMRRGFQIGLSIDCSFPQAAYMMMVGCHSTTIWLGRQDLFLGVAMGCCYRLLVAASLGEFRRYDNNVLGKHTSIGSRDDVYRNVWDKIRDEAVTKRFIAAMKSYDEDYWGGSIGGANWYILSRWAAVLLNAIIDGDEKAALDALNKGTNSVHNGGWTFNKFIRHDEMNKTAENPIYALLQIAPFLYDSLNLKDVKTIDLTKFEVKDIDPKEYLEEKKYKPNPKKTIKAANKTKKCCSSDCCGNPDCAECHPVKAELPGNPIDKMFPSCPWLGDDHEGSETLLEVIKTSASDGVNIFPVCEKHKPKYLENTYYKLYEPKSEIKLEHDSCKHFEANHKGKEVVITDGAVFTPACEAHLQHYLPHGWKIVEDKPDKPQMNQTLDKILGKTNKVEPLKNAKNNGYQCGDSDCPCMADENETENEEYEETEEV